MGTWIGDWTVGDVTGIDLVAATIDAFAGASLVRTPGHDRGFTVVGVIVLGIIAGIGSGIVRGVVSNDLIDVASGIPPFHLLHGASYVGVPVLVAILHLIATEIGLSIWPATLIAVAAGAFIRLGAIRRGWEDSPSGSSSPPARRASCRGRCSRRRSCRGG